MSEGRVRPAQELDLLRRARAREALVPMRETAEAIDDLAMTSRGDLRLRDLFANTFGRVAGELLVELARALLQRDVFGVHDRQIEDEPLARRELAIDAELETLERQ